MVTVTEGINDATEALALLDGVLKLIASIKARHGLTNEQISQIARNKFSVNAETIQAELNRLP